jgi:hypothetical protein
MGRIALLRAEMAELNRIVDMIIHKPSKKGNKFGNDAQQI